MDTPAIEEHPRSAWHGIAWRYVTTEVVLFVAAYFAYFLVRGMTEGSPERAFVNADEVIALQEALGIDWEITMQGWITDSPFRTAVANWVYMYGHWPVIVVVAVWLLIVYPREYRVVRNAFLISGAIGLVVFATYPVAPPRLMDIGLIDTVTEHSRSYRVLQPPALVNQYAAVPSLHFGWNLLVGVILVRVAHAPAARLFGFFMPPVMFLSIVLTANHYVIDGILGAIVALFGLAAALGLRRLGGHLSLESRSWWRLLCG